MSCSAKAMSCSAVRPGGSADSAVNTPVCKPDCVCGWHTPHHPVSSMSSTKHDHWIKARSGQGDNSAEASTVSYDCFTVSQHVWRVQVEQLWCVQLGSLVPSRLRLP